jgi:putative ATP-dependent endonuclease of the OLD family
VILGENNAGKTNLIDAIRIAIGYSSFSTAETVRVNKEDLFRELNGKIFSSTINIDLWFSDLSIDQQGEFLDILEFNQDDHKKSKASIHYEWTWNDNTKKFQERRWGGNQDEGDRSVPSEVSQAVPTTFLSALRDAVSALMPGRSNRLGKFLNLVADSDSKSAVEQIFKDANNQLRNIQAIKDMKKIIDKSLESATGPELAPKVELLSSEVRHEKIFSNLRLATILGSYIEDDSKKEFFQELEDNGLGYNNLIFIATILAELESSKSATLPIFLVEEPEAHLHPQLQTLLAKCLGNTKIEGQPDKKVQTIITSHSPHIAVESPIESLMVLHQDIKNIRRCVKLVSDDFTKAEKRKIHRMLDVSKASLLFAKGIILVEGITEALLIPVFAQRMGKNLAARGISVIPVCGVDFKTLGQLIGASGLHICTSIITDSDPNKIYAKEDINKEFPFPEEKDSEIVPCKRLTELKEGLKDNSHIKIFNSSVTLEYDLAMAKESNCETISIAWNNCYKKSSYNLNSTELEKLKAHDKKTLLIWRTICLSDSQVSKGDFASSLADLLSEKDDKNNFIIPNFEIPEYIQNAIQHVWDNANVTKH